MWLYQIYFEINDALYSTFDTYDFFGDCLNQIVDLEKMQFDEVYKIIICSKTPIEKNLLNKISKTSRGIITDNGTLCQITNKGVSKWNGIEVLLNNHGIKREDVIAFGDDYNDFDMIKNSGIGVAMGNAEDCIKQIADYTTSSNMEEGISNFLKQYLKK